MENTNVDRRLIEIISAGRRTCERTIVRHGGVATPDKGRLPLKTKAWFLKTAGSPLVEETLEIADPGPGRAIVEVAACGLCHTDLGYAEGSVAPRHALPLVLGHEITGTVVAAANAELVGRRVLVPAVMGCGDCPYCRAGRDNACPRQKMPGNDIHGGFAQHVEVPAAALVSLEDMPASVKIDSLSVVADAVSTAYQAVLRSGLAAGDVAIVVGGGGVGTFVAQIARALGAKTVVCDVSPERLEAAKTFGADRTVNVKDREAKDVRKEVHGAAKEWQPTSMNWRIFECSGTTAGQTLAYTMLAQACTMMLVGFTRDATNVRLSNLMAFDATVHGTWGCALAAYPAVLSLIYQGKVQIEPFIERAPMSRLNDMLGALSRHELSKRMVLNPRA
jgi:6-hydroxycyclohex-1-ene-1-carbonyl-CoA dehydrogenase